MINHESDRISYYFPRPYEVGLAHRYRSPKTTSALRSISQKLQSGSILTRADLVEIYEQFGLSKASVGNLVSEMKLGRFEQETGVPVATQLYRGSILMHDRRVPIRTELEYTKRKIDQLKRDKRGKRANMR